MKIFTPLYWRDYELIDSGRFKKLERFGNFITIRPEPQAVWDSHEDIDGWKQKAHVEFVPTSANSGQWKKYKSMPDSWEIKYPLNGNDANSISFRLALTGFKHVGIFPEQAVNWEFIYNQCQKKPGLNVLNLFAYTGAASIVAAKAKASTVHVDSVKQIVNWASGNAKMNDISSIRWMIDDASKFVKREMRRGKKYNGIILDPPAFGHGPNGEDWKLERDINEILKNIAEIADKDNFFLILNVYSLGLSVLVLENLIASIFKTNEFEAGELFLKDRYEKKLPLGVFIQLKK
ncbi:MAG TPA: class I SAM-dependent methyltransferase [Bacteroidales bacterium]|jgi:23S rRNA (cytosine1962-C5)-methyltransferase|nr:class I SAM-dependent methyltransferase [Bacteroidales bacterium]